MLQNNEELISFVPGQRLPNETIHGKIIVHDRNRVQSEVLPVYFNHASFASLRRQLSYFSFVRVGKSRQSGVTYTNDSVVELSDIRKLKRRSVGQAGAAAKLQQTAKRCQNGTKKQLPQPQLQPPQQQAQKHQVQLQQPQNQEAQQLVVTTTLDVASAVRSGALHAAKTNHNLDMSNNTNSNSNEGSSSSTFSPVTQSQSSISQSNSRGSTSSSNSFDRENACGSKTSENRSGLIPKKKVKKQHSIPRKDRARYDRLLSANNIVPFIHLPVGYTMGRSKKQKEESMMGSGESSSNASKENKHKGRERATSDGAINALLALGADRQ